MVNKYFATATFRYQALLAIISFPLSFFLLYLAIKHRDRLFFWQRLGYKFPQQSQASIWIHTASVGEVIAALPLIQALQNQHGNVVVTTTTPTGAQTLKNRLGSQCQCCYLPIDWRFAINRLFFALNPKCIFVVETEIWPNLYSAAHQQNIPLVVINGRLSQRTLSAPAWVLSLYQSALKNVDTVFARSQLDADRFISLGAVKDKVEVLGNLKFCQSINRDAGDTPLLHRPYVLVASTHYDEEIRIAEIWNSLEVENRLLVIAPRHPKRRSAIIKDLSDKTSDLAIRSAGDNVSDSTTIYLADTLGELNQFIAFADFVIMGGSLINHGGQNILEPARYGKAIVVGPSMENFTEETELLHKADALIQCRDDDELREQLKLLLASPERVASLGQHARQVIEANNHILENYLTRIQPFISTDS